MVGYLLYQRGVAALCMLLEIISFGSRLLLDSAAGSIHAGDLACESGRHELLHV